MTTPTVKGGYWGDLGSSVLVVSDDDPIKRRIAELLDRPQFRELKELMLTLNGAAAGEAASATHKRVLARENADGELGGLRTIQTVTDVTGNTTSAQETNIDETVLAYPMAPSSYPANGDGNPRGVAGG